MLVVVGRDNSEVSLEQLQALLDRVRRGPIDVRSYNDIYMFALEHYQHNRLIVLFGQMGPTREAVSGDMILLAKIQEELSRLVPKGSRFALSGLPAKSEIREFDPGAGELHIDLGTCRFVEGSQVIQMINREMKKRIPELHNVSASIREI